MLGFLCAKTGRACLPLIAAACLCSAGCLSVPYRSANPEKYPPAEQLLAITEPQIERGAEYPVLDGLGWVLGIPDKIVLWDCRVSNHHISAETEVAIAEYLAVNNLPAVKVRLNQYHPGDEWRRLVANKRVGWGWRYSLGTLSCIGYTIFPGRVFGGDNYNPFTNTVSIYSDVPAIALHEGGHSKDFSRRRFPGTYAAIYLLPGAPLWHEGVATNDALSYLHEYGTPEGEREGYRLLYPAYGTYVAGATNDLLPTRAPGGFIIYGTAVLGGHVLGRIRAARVQDAPPSTEEAATGPIENGAVEVDAPSLPVGDEPPR